MRNSLLSVATLIAVVACSGEGAAPDDSGSTSASGGAGSSGVPANGAAPAVDGIDQPGEGVPTASGGSGTTQPSGSCSPAADWASDTSMSTTHGASLCKSTLRVGVFGDSNWEGGQIALKLSVLRPEWEFVNIAQGGSGKTLTNMLNLSPELRVGTGDSGQGPLDVVLLGVGTNDGRCNAGAPCTADPFPEGVEGDKTGAHSWCHAGQSDANEVQLAGVLDYMIGKFLATDPNILPVVVGPAPTWDPTDPASIYCPDCGCGYGYGSSAFMKTLTEEFKKTAGAFQLNGAPRAIPMVDIHTPLLAMSDPNNERISPVSVDGVHYSHDDGAVTVVAEEILRVLDAAVTQ